MCRRAFTALPHTIDRFNAVSVDLAKDPPTSSFGAQLHRSVQEWSAKGHKAVWIQLRMLVVVSRTNTICIFGRCESDCDEISVRVLRV